MPFYNSLPTNPAEYDQHTISDRPSGMPLDYEKMPLILPSNTLPSNAPSLPQLEEYGVHNRSYQGRCSSRQEELLDYDYQRCAQPFSPAESAFINDFRRGKYPNVKHKSAEDIVKEANRLWRRLLRCKPYSKYRERKPKDNPTSQDMKWPENLEVAFCQALIIYPPVGRRMVASGDSNKARGRNELIADFIQRYTGEPRTRKQVSSHIQVLKPMVKEDQVVTDHLAVPEHKNLGHRGRHSRRISIASTPSTRYSSHDSVQVPHRSASMLPTSYRSMSYTPVRSVSPIRLSTPAPAFMHEPMHFEMFIRDNSRGESSLPLHTFTSFSQSQVRIEDLHVADTVDLCHQLPQLSSILSSENLASSQILVAESRLRLMSDHLPKGAELGIQFEVNSLCNLGIYEDFTCETRFFEDGESACEPIHGRIDYNAHFQRMGNIQFGSDFWARKVIETAQQLRRVEELRNKADDLRSCGLDGGMSELADPLDDEARETEDEVRNSIRGMTGLQEISARFKATGEKVRLFIICWNFEQQVGEGEASITWRNVTIGSSSQNNMGSAQQLQLPFFQQAVLRNNSFGPGSSVEDISCILPPHMQQQPNRRHSYNPHQMQQSHFGSMEPSDLPLDYTAPSMDFNAGLQMSFDAPLNVSFNTTFSNTPTLGPFDPAFDNQNATAGVQTPYQTTPWQTPSAFSHGTPYSTNSYFSPQPQHHRASSTMVDDDSHSYTFNTPASRHHSESSFLAGDTRRGSVVSNGTYDSHTSSAYSASPFVPSLGSFAEEIGQRRAGSLGLLQSERRHSTAPGGQETTAFLGAQVTAGYAEGRKGSMQC
ncbi:TEA-domain-containing protein [Venturia nashicola]|uniref:TEA-domain-containing protein n=1 Tax=Venturia nashicola TaxID=86259 RepID=A0A4Z1PB74_9PEZI|nr:TEA-domain-containing protein [Venturia nashicola]